MMIIKSRKDLIEVLDRNIAVAEHAKNTAAKAWVKHHEGGVAYLKTIRDLLADEAYTKINIQEDEI